MTDHALPNLAAMSAEMATNLSRTTTYADIMATAVDQLVTAAAQDDWDALGAISRQLADESRKNGRRDVSAMAKIVCEESKKSKNSLGSKRSLIRLIGACGR